MGEAGIGNVKAIVVTAGVMIFLQLAGPGSFGEENRALVRSIRKAGAAEGAKAFYEIPGERKKLKVGMKLGAGVVVETLPGSLTDLVLKENGPVVRLTSGTRVKLARLEKVQEEVRTRVETVLELERGRLLGNVKFPTTAELSGGSYYKVKLPDGEMEVETRDVQFDLQADGRLTVIAGSCQLRFKEGIYLLKAGEEFDPKTKRLSMHRICPNRFPFLPPPDPSEISPEFPKRKF
jgi:hypothetical protein